MLFCCSTKKRSLNQKEKLIYKLKLQKEKLISLKNKIEEQAINKDLISEVETIITRIENVVISVASNSNEFTNQYIKTLLRNSEKLKV